MASVRRASLLARYHIYLLQTNLAARVDCCIVLRRRPNTLSGQQGELHDVGGQV
jgi:hypothetical protein